MTNIIESHFGTLMSPKKIAAGAASIVRKQGAFVAGTSAQGVRRRQSSAARSGRSAMGTKQLARNNMQIKSLNI